MIKGSKSSWICIDSADELELAGKGPINDVTTAAPIGVDETTNDAGLMPQELSQNRKVASYS